MSATPQPGAHQGTDSTRDRLIDAISTHGPIAAGDLAERFGLTGAAVRRHLTQLEADGIIQERESSQRTRTRGRPRKEFVLATHADGGQLSECEELALLAMAELEAAGGADALVRLARARTDKWEREFHRRYRSELRRSGEMTPARRVSLVIELLQELGYAASLRPVTVTVGAASDDGEGPSRTLTTVQLCQGRCPVQDIATRHPELCDVETAALSRMLGVPVQRLATRASGAHVCTTHLTPAMGQAILADAAAGGPGAEITTDLLTEGRKP
ncbi:MAG: MarR family transcriptional regulator [Dermabacter sp.]|nr:MarR family transcriptional regulator [Dermabacter sp.]